MGFKFYDYQREDVDKLVDQPFALIGSEMGTGKTHEAIELAFQWWGQVVVDAQQVLPILVICPIDVMPSWEAKFKQQYPDLDVLVIDRKDREAFKAELLMNTYHVYIMHWAAVNLLTDWIVANKVIFSVVVADEVHKISNRNAQTSKNLKKIKTYSKLGLSGTASGDKPWNLWSVLNWLDPNGFKSFWRFVNTFVTEEVQYRGSSSYRSFTGAKNVAYLHSIMEPWYVRHLKAEQCCKHHPQGVMPWLPQKINEQKYVELSAKQRKVYDQMLSEMVAWLGDNGDVPLVAPVVIAQLTRLSQIALANPIITTEHTGEFDMFGEEYVNTIVNLEMPSSKFEALKEIITGGEYPEGKRFVVFTSSKKMAYLVSQELAKIGISNKMLSGDTKPDERAKMVDEFRAGEFQVFLGVIAAVAEGIDGLQHASDVLIFLDRHRSAIKNVQAEDRLHRGGQKFPVTIIDIIAKDTIDEEWVLGRLPEKWSRIKEILNVK